MTVKQLINKLKRFPENYKVVIPNDAMWDDGVYYATSVDEWINETVIIETDRKKEVKARSKANEEM